ncbi:hypothetical protein U3516DRAFT_373604 [Neocallimastix sp. 'constans']|jgi:hypothetical protein
MKLFQKLTIAGIFLLGFSSQASAKAVTKRKCYIKKTSKTIKALEDNKYSISIGDVTMTIDASYAAKIISYKIGNDEVLNQDSFQNYSGSTFWTSPQNDWGWPPVEEYDSKPFTAKIVGDKLVMNGQKSKFGYSISKEFNVNKKNNSIEVKYSINNESDETRQVAPWEISRVPNDGILFFQADKVEPGNDMTGLPFQFKHGAAWYEMDEDEDHRKINADGNGWIAYSAKGLLFVKTFQDLDPSETAPGEAEIQSYAFPGKTYVEVEEQGVYTTVKPGESVSWTVNWYLTHTDLEPVPSEDLLKEVKKLIKKLN